VEQITRFDAAGEARIARVGADLAKRVFQVHAVDGVGRGMCRRSLPREKFVAWCARLPAGCVVAMEMSSGAHHFARRLQALGLQPRLMSAQLVAPYRSEGASGKNDANDAAAICEAASRPTMRFVPVKSVEQQSMLCVHRLREGLKTERTACINRIRGLLAEFGLVFAQSPDALRRVLAEVIEDAGNEMNALARRVILRSQEHWRELDAHIAWCDERIAQHARENPAVRRAAQLVGIGTLGASAVVATVDDFAQFKNGAQFGAWCGIVPRQHSSGGKTQLGAITRRGDAYLRSLLVQGAKSAVFTAHKRTDPISRWTLALRERSGWQVAAVALANKNARILWAMMTRGETFDPRHVSVKPGAIGTSTT
jgi:transposase